MPSGSTQQVVVCIPKNPNTGNSTAPCATVGSTRYVPATINAFVVDPSMQQSLTAIQNANNGSIDYGQAGTWFGAAFTLVMVIWFVSVKLGAIISLIKKA
jgi:hypothetical protein